MKLSQFKFKLPEERIALRPSYHRDECKLMVVHKKTGDIEHKVFKDVLDYFDEKDVFVFNDTKVFPARLYGNKEKTGARIEVFLLRDQWLPRLSTIQHQEVVRCDSFTMVLTMSSRLLFMLSARLQFLIS